MILDCFYTDPPHQHEFPEDWVFGGANGFDPRADPRYEVATYYYYSADAQLLWTTQTPLCDDQAIDEFTKIASRKGERWNPAYIFVKRFHQPVERIPWVYDKATDTASYQEVLA